MNKICINCNRELPIENFYTFKKKDLTTAYYNKCNKCHQNYKRKPTGINKLHPRYPGVKNELMNDLQDRRLTVKDIAYKHNTQFELHFSAPFYTWTCV